jgi:hypothetical protein
VKVAQLLGLPIPLFTEMVEKILYRDAMKAGKTSSSSA